MAAPATVSGELPPEICHWRDALGRFGWTAKTRKPGDLPSDRRVLNLSAVAALNKTPGCAFGGDGLVVLFMPQQIPCLHSQSVSNQAMPEGDDL